MMRQRSGPEVGEGIKTEELDLEAMVKASGTNVSSIDDCTIDNSDGDRSRKLLRTMKVFDVVSNGEGRGGVGMPGFGSRDSSDGWKRRDGWMM